MKLIRNFMVAASLAVVMLPADAAPSAATQREINGLMQALENSGCRFQRNGSWYDSAKAADHLRGKYDYLLKKGWGETSEDFITRAASESSMSHKPYQVRCAGKEAEPSSSWLKAELTRYRSK